MATSRARNCVIIRLLGAPGFWTGHRWSNEYPDARLYTPGEAARAKKTTAFGCHVRIVCDYGTDNERYL